MTVSTLCVGGDIHQDELHLRAADKADGHEVGQRLTVKNNRPGADQTIMQLVQWLTQHGYTHLEFGLEATGLFWLPFYTYLQQSPALAPFQPTWVCFNPKLVAQFKDGLTLSEIKDDDHDALAVAERLRFGRLPVSYVPSAEWLALRMLTRYRYRLSRQIGQEKVRAFTRVFLKASEWHRGQPFSDPWGATSATLLTEFTVAEIAAMSLTQLTDLIQEYGRKHFDDPQATARQVQRTLQTSFPVAPELDAAITVVLRVAWTHIRDLEKLMRRLDREIAQRMERIGNPLLSVNGLGPVITAGIVAEIADTLTRPFSRSSATRQVHRIGVAQTRLGQFRRGRNLPGQDRQRLSTLLRHRRRRPHPPAQLGIPSLLSAQVCRGAETSAQARPRLDRS
jgi:transposase